MRVFSYVDKVELYNPELIWREYYLKDSLIVIKRRIGVNMTYRA